MSTSVEVIAPEEPVFFASDADAFEYHNRVGGYLWKLIPNAPDGFGLKPWVAGIPLPIALGVYDLHSVNGRAANDDDRVIVRKASYDKNVEFLKELAAACKYEERDERAL